MNRPIKTSCVLLLAALAAQPCVGMGQDSTAAVREGPQVGDLRTGDTLQRVLAIKGHPSSEMSAGSLHVLNYPDEVVRLRDDVVFKVEPVVKGSVPAASALPAPSTGSQDAYAPPHAIVLGTDAVGDEIGAFARMIRSKLKGGSFGELEQLSAQLIREKSLFRDGLWKIDAFHEALDLSGNASEEAWTTREGQIEKWEEQFPASVTARVAHIRFLTSYAWHARGSGWAGSVKDESWPIFENRLAQAYIVLQSARKLEEKSPMLWAATQTLALGQGWPVEEVTKAFEEAKETEPEFWIYDYQMAYFLMPRWYGKEGDWEAFAEAEMQRKDGIGAEGYARLVFAMKGFYKNVFKETRAQWAPVKEGYLAMLKKYPDAKRLLSQYACLAVLADDRPAAHEAFEEMEGHGDPSVWSADGVARYQEWAYRRP